MGENVKINYNWQCIECGNHTIEEVLPGVTQSSTITDIYKDENNDLMVEYSHTSTEGGDIDSIRYQCLHCGAPVDIDELLEIARKDIRHD